MSTKIPPDLLMFVGGLTGVSLFTIGVRRRHRHLSMFAGMIFMVFVGLGAVLAFISQPATPSLIAVDAALVVMMAITEQVWSGKL